MRVGERHYRSIWVEPDGWSVGVIDQTRLPHRFETRRLGTVADAAEAIRTMVVRGAPLVGATAAYGVCLALRQDPGDASLERACTLLAATRPTAVNLAWALGELRAAVAPLAGADRVAAAYARADAICDDDVALCSAIGDRGLSLIESAARRADERGRVEILTHCNAGWLATVDWGTALAPVYKAFDRGIRVHVWVDETRPRNQGASLTAWELGQHGVPHTIIADNAGGHLMQHGKIDLCLVGTDRTTARGDVANKIGTYLKALAAHDNGVPFYVCAPSPSIDWSLDDGREIPIEERDGREVTAVSGRLPDGSVASVEITPAASPAANYAFDVTPARLVTGLVTERGICAASRDGLLSLFPERAKAGRGA
jgi:methylthioribose-1-phosphate isomerase